MKDTIIIVPSARPSPLLTLSHLRPKSYPVVLLSDPRFYADHRRWVKTLPIAVEVIKGKIGLRNQLEVAYKTAYRRGVTWFRLDDDLKLPGNLYGKDELHPKVTKLIDLCRRYMDECSVSLVGPRNFKNQSWLKEGYGRSYCYLTAQCQLVSGSKDPYADGYLDKNLSSDLEEEVYRCLAHRARDGANGVVNSIGVDSAMGYNPEDRAIVFSRERWLKDIEYICTKFAGMVECKWKDGNRKFRMLPGQFQKHNW